MMKFSLTRMTSLLLVLLPLTISTTGCNTVAGAGEDLEAAGDSIENSAEQNKGY